MELMLLVLLCQLAIRLPLLCWDAPAEDPRRELGAT